MPYCHSVLTLALVYGAISLTFNMVNTSINCLSMWMLVAEGRQGQPDPPFSVGFLLNTLRCGGSCTRSHFCTPLWI